jgi:Tripartite tricarboxylate transporter family receptor
MRTLTLAAITLAPVVAASIALPAQAQQDYPSRTVTVVNPTQAGATTDVLARALVVGLSNRLGQQFVVVNRTGASGAIGTASVARAAPDGYTLLFGAVYVLSVLPAARSNDIGYDAQSLVPVCQTSTIEGVRPEEGQSGQWLGASGQENITGSPLPICYPIVDGSRRLAVVIAEQMGVDRQCYVGLGVA